MDHPARDPPLATSRATITTKVHGSRDADRLVRYFRGRRTLGEWMDGRDGISTATRPMSVHSGSALCAACMVWDGSRECRNKSLVGVS